MADTDYTKIDRPYDSHLERDTDLDVNLMDDAEMATVGGLSSSSGDGEPVIKSEKSLSDIWISNWIRSKDWKPKTQGFYIDGRTGYAEFSNVYIVGGLTTSLIKGGQTDFDTGTGFFLGYSVDAYKLSVGVGGIGPSITWDGQRLTIRGSIINDINAGTDLALQEYVHDIEFTPAEDNSLFWSDGVITMSNGETFNIEGTGYVQEPVFDVSLNPFHENGDGVIPMSSVFMSPLYRGKKTYVISYQAKYANVGNFLKIMSVDSSSYVILKGYQTKVSDISFGVFANIKNDNTLVAIDGKKFILSNRRPEETGTHKKKAFADVYEIKGGSPEGYFMAVSADGVLSVTTPGGGIAEIIPVKDDVGHDLTVRKVVEDANFFYVISTAQEVFGSVQISRYKKDALQEAPVVNRNFNFSLSSTATDFADVYEGHLYIGTAGGVLARFNLSIFSSTAIPSFSPHTTGGAIAAVQGYDGKVYVGGANINGIYIYDVLNFTTSPSVYMGGTHVPKGNYLLLDSNNLYWFHDGVGSFSYRTALPLSSNSPVQVFPPNSIPYGKIVATDTHVYALGGRLPIYSSTIYDLTEASQTTAITVTDDGGMARITFPSSIVGTLCPVQNPPTVACARGYGMAGAFPNQTTTWWSSSGAYDGGSDKVVVTSYPAAYEGPIWIGIGPDSPTFKITHYHKGVYQGGVITMDSSTSPYPFGVVRRVKTLSAIAQNSTFVGEAIEGFRGSLHVDSGNVYFAGVSSLGGGTDYVKGIKKIPVASFGTVPETTTYLESTEDLSFEPAADFSSISLPRPEIQKISEYSYSDGDSFDPLGTNHFMMIGLNRFAAFYTYYDEETMMDYARLKILNFNPNDNTFLPAGETDVVPPVEVETDDLLITYNRVAASGYPSMGSTGTARFGPCSIRLSNLTPHIRYTPSITISSGRPLYAHRGFVWVERNHPVWEVNPVTGVANASGRFVDKINIMSLSEGFTRNHVYWHDATVSSTFGLTFAATSFPNDSPWNFPHFCSTRWDNFYLEQTRFKKTPQEEQGPVEVYQEPSLHVRANARKPNANLMSHIQDTRQDWVVFTDDGGTGTNYTGQMFFKKGASWLHRPDSLMAPYPFVSPRRGMVGDKYIYKAGSKGVIRSFLWANDLADRGIVQDSWAGNIHSIGTNVVFTEKYAFATGGVGTVTSKHCRFIKEGMILDREIPDWVPGHSVHFGTNVYHTDGFLYVMAGNVVRRYDPESYTWTGDEWNFGTTLKDFAIQGNYLYMTGGAMYNGSARYFRRFNLLDPSEPYLQWLDGNFSSTGSSAGQPRKLYLQGNYAYVSGSMNYFKRYNLNDHTAPSLQSHSLVGAPCGSSQTFSLYLEGVHNNYVYVVANTQQQEGASFYQYSISDITAPPEISANLAAPPYQAPSSTSCYFSQGVTSLAFDGANIYAAGEQLVDSNGDTTSIVRFLESDISTPQEYIWMPREGVPGSEARIKGEVYIDDGHLYWNPRPSGTFGSSLWSASRKKIGNLQAPLLTGETIIKESPPYGVEGDATGANGDPITEMRYYDNKVYVIGRKGASPYVDSTLKVYDGDELTVLQESPSLGGEPDILEIYKDKVYVGSTAQDKIFVFDAQDVTTIQGEVASEELSLAKFIFAEDVKTSFTQCQMGKMTFLNPQTVVTSYGTGFPGTHNLLVRTVDISNPNSPFVTAVKAVSSGMQTPYSDVRRVNLSTFLMAFDDQDRGSISTDFGTVLQLYEVSGNNIIERDSIQFEGTTKPMFPRIHPLNGGRFVLVHKGPHGEDANCDLLTVFSIGTDNTFVKGLTAKIYEDPNLLYQDNDIFTVDSSNIIRVTGAYDTTNPPHGTQRINITPSGAINIPDGSIIYFDKDISETELQITQDPKEAVGPNKIMIGYVKPSPDPSSTPSFTPVKGQGGVVVNESQIFVPSLGAITHKLGEVEAGTITVGQNGSIRGGQNSFSAGKGFFLGDEGGRKKVSVGDPMESFFAWDESTGKMEIRKPRIDEITLTVDGEDKGRLYTEDGAVWFDDGSVEAPYRLLMVPEPKIEMAEDVPLIEVITREGDLDKEMSSETSLDELVSMNLFDFDKVVESELSVEGDVVAVLFPEFPSKFDEVILEEDVAINIDE